MSLEKAIASGEEHRKEYKGAQKIDKSCRCNGSCPYCRNNRLHSSLLRVKQAEEDINEYLEKQDQN